MSTEEPETLTPNELLMRCSICVVHWNQDIKRNTIPKTGLCMGVDPASIEAFAEFSSRLWDAMGKPAEEISHRITSNAWGVNETLKFLEGEYALFESENR